MPALGDHGRVLDVACGNGAVTRQALHVAHRLHLPTPSIHGLDLSLPAMVQWQKHFASSLGAVADAARMPFADRSFRIVASQFGIEYAGAAAMAEAGRLVAEPGALAAVLHLAGGGIHRECDASLQAVTGVADCRLLPRATEAFRAAISARQRRGQRNRLRRADRELRSALLDVQKILNTFGPAVAGGSIQRLHTDVTEMYARAHAYDPRAVTEWTTRMSRELAAYGERMRLMLRAALDEAGLEAVLSGLIRTGMAVRVREPMLMGPRNEPAAWALVCDRH